MANKQLELMGRYMVELGLTPAARSRVSVAPMAAPGPIHIELVSGASSARDNLKALIDRMAARIRPGDVEAEEAP